jgi:hypothetical protein
MQAPLLPPFSNFYSSYLNGGEGSDCNTVRCPQHAARFHNETSV